MIGAITGDIIGSVFEHCPTTNQQFKLFSSESQFTDDTVLTVATADALLNKKGYTKTYRDYFHQYPEQGYGGSFKKWARSTSLESYGSWGNGSAMRVSPIGWYFSSLSETLEEAKRSSEVTHSHPDAISAAQAVAGSIYLARVTRNKDIIRDFLENTFKYDLNRTISEIQNNYAFDVSAKGSVPEAIIAFLDSNDYESAIRNAIFFGGDADTQACISGSIAQAYYDGMGLFTHEEIFKRSDSKLASITYEFSQKYCQKSVREYIKISGNDFWFKPLENHQQNWALIENNHTSNKVAVYFLKEVSGVFDRLIFETLNVAITSLRNNQFRCYSEEDDVKKWFNPPELPFFIDPHPSGYIYSSRKYWKTKAGKRYV